MKSTIFTFLIIFTVNILSGESQTFKLSDGTEIVGTIQAETDTTLTLITQFGNITIDKNKLVKKTYSITLSSGGKLVGTKTKETEDELILNTQLGNLTIQKNDIIKIVEVGQQTESASTPGERSNYRPYSLFDLFYGATASSKDMDFSLGEEQLIDLFFDPTGYTLPQSTLYLSGLSFGFGVTENFQITTKWGGFFWGDMNLRPKFKLFESGNWEKQHALSVGAHIHTRWQPDKYEWQSGSIEVTTFTGESNEYGDTYCPGSETYCWKQTSPAVTSTKYWGGYYKLGENVTNTIEYNTPEDYDPNATNEYYSHEPWENSCFNCDYYETEYLEMLEIFSAYTFSKAREGLRGRISHTFGGNMQYFTYKGEPTVFYRAYYGLDVDINSRLKMISEVFYDPNYLELWQRWDSQQSYWSSDQLSSTPVDKPTDYRPLHFDFGFMYALNESFRFGLHFQQPFIGFYWKF